MFSKCWFLPIIKLKAKHVQLVLQEKGIKLFYEFENWIFIHFLTFSWDIFQQFWFLNDCKFRTKNLISFQVCIWKIVHSYFITTLNAFYGTYLHTCYSTHAVNNRLGFGIFLARRLDISCLRRTVGLNSQNTPKNKIKKIREIDWS